MDAILEDEAVGSAVLDETCYYFIIGCNSGKALDANTKVATQFHEDYPQPFMNALDYSSHSQMVCTLTQRKRSCAMVL